MKKPTYRLMIRGVLLVGPLLGLLAWVDWEPRYGLTKDHTLADFGGLSAPEINTPVRISFRGLKEKYVYQTEDNVWGSGNLRDDRRSKRTRKATEHAWKRVWLTLRGSGGDWGDGTECLLIMSDRIKSPTELESLVDSGHVTGVITDAVQALSGAERAQLRPAFAFLDVESVPILKHGPTMLGMAVRLLSGLGAVACLVCALIGAWRLYRPTKSRPGTASSVRREFDWIEGSG